MNMEPWREDTDMGKPMSSRETCLTVSTEIPDALSGTESHRRSNASATARLRDKLTRIWDMDRVCLWRNDLARAGSKDKHWFIHSQMMEAEPAVETLECFIQYSFVRISEAFLILFTC
jgi:hypothetical protein